MGTLFVVATPIGNMEDITLRALRVLREVPLIAAEDTRTTRALLTRHGVSTRLTAYTDHNKQSRIPTLLAHLAAADLALVSEAGTPAVSDPGQDLVAAAVAAGHAVVPVPGPSALLAALVASALPTRTFLYLGFLPRTAGERRRLFGAVSGLGHTLIAYESPHRVTDSLADALAALGDRPVAVCRELTKLHEEVIRATLATVAQRMAPPRGEYTLVIGGAGSAGPSPEPNLDSALGEVATAVTQGVSARDAIISVAARHSVARRRLYEAWQQRERQ